MVKISSYKIIALIVAAGSGERASSDIPKQYADLGGMPVLRHSVQTFLNHPGIDAVCVVINPDYMSHYEQLVQGLVLLPMVAGGRTRQESVRKGLEQLAVFQPEYVLVHDAARPLVSPEVISRVVVALPQHKAVVPVLPVADTLKRHKETLVTATIDRENIYRAQTPQGFYFNELLAIHRAAAEHNLEVTDDVSLYELANRPVQSVEGEERNFKITQKEDFKRAECLLYTPKEAREVLSAMGFDVHRFCPPKKKKKNVLYLCGVEVPHEESLEGHSDADVALHALTDALLGTIGAGDIGMHFPPSDKQWKDADSTKFLLHARKLVEEAQGRIRHVDITIIGERPKVGPHRDAMKQRLAELLDLPLNRVSVKATTTEKLGFTGRKEGLAAQAMASVSFPIK